jgi:hypothetical protein
VPANTFDNVKGRFPIGFKIWDTNHDKHFIEATVDIYDADGTYVGKKIYHDGPECRYINDWFRQYHDKKNKSIGVLHKNRNDFQNVNLLWISSDDNFDHTTPITKKNCLQVCVYYAVQKVIPATWINDRDQFLYPKDDWQDDFDFQTDCLAFTLFHTNNNISSKQGANHWIPFTEKEVNAQERFESRFMTDFIAGKVDVIPTAQYSAITIDDECPHVASLSPATLVEPISNRRSKQNQPHLQHGGELTFSPRSTAVFDAGRELWRYYHSQNTPSASVHPSTRGEYNANASFYDIREHFQGRDAKGKMNSTCDDERYNQLITDLRFVMKLLAKQIEPKIYEYGFLI